MPSFADNPSTREERLNEIIADYLEAVAAGRKPDRQVILTRHPDLASELAAFFADQERFQRAAGQLAVPLPCPPLAQRDAAMSQVPTVGPGETLPDPSLGTVRYVGDYELLEKIAEGGMGVVYRARQVSLQRTVALKMIRAGQFAGDDDVRRFQAEAQMAAQLHHPNIVSIYEIGEDHGQHYFAMEYIDGRDLGSLIRDNLLPPLKAAAYVRTVAEAIAYAHTQKTLHRDLKPSNILIDAADQPHVTDFGLAKRLGEQTGLTVTGQVVGTPSYMSPEQASGRNAEIGPASDVYALGAVLYELVTGRPPFKAATVIDTLVQVCATEPVSPRLLNPQVPRDIEAICLKCLQKEPQKRYGSAQELADDLGRFLAGEPTHARPPFIPLWAQAWFRQNLRAILYVTLAGVLGGLLASLSSLLDEQALYFKARSVYARSFPALPRPEPVLNVPETGHRAPVLLGLGEGMSILIVGILVLWLVRPVRRGGKVAAGAAAGLVLVFTFFALAGGVEVFEDSSLKAVRSDLAILALGGGPRSAALEVNYPNLLTVPGEDREARLASKVLADLPLRITATIRLRTLRALRTVAFCALCPLILSHLVRKDNRFRLTLWFVLSTSLLGYVLLLSPIDLQTRTVIREGGRVVGRETSPSFGAILITLLLLSIVAFWLLLAWDLVKLLFRARWSGLLVVLAVCASMVSAKVSSLPELQGTWFILLIEGIPSLVIILALWVSLTTESEEEADVSTFVPR
jgi:serine/threonine protein kinase